MRFPVLASLALALSAQVGVFASVGIREYVDSASETEDTEHDVTLSVVNVCDDEVNLYWLHFNQEEEIYLSTIPAGHQFTQETDVGQVFRVKWGNNNGVFGEDIMQEFDIEDLGENNGEQEVFVCEAARAALDEEL